MSCDKEAVINRSETYGYLRNAGLRMTPLKKQIVELFLQGGCGLSMAEVSLALHDRYAPSSVYRCLRALTGAGFLRHSLNSEGVVQYRCTSPFFPDHGHFHCGRCGGVIPVRENLPAGFLKDIEKKYDLRIENTDLHLEGTCEKCSEQQL